MLWKVKGNLELKKTGIRKCWFEDILMRLQTQEDIEKDREDLALNPYITSSNSKYHQATVITKSK